MEDAMNLNLEPNHIAGGFEWEKAPSCSCGLLAKAFEEKVIFASNITDEGRNLCYVFLLDSDGNLHRSDGTTIAYCPWCGDKIEIRKKYPTQ
jgi:hypothetical protein